MVSSSEKAHWIPISERTPGKNCVVYVRIEGFMRFNEENKETPFEPVTNMQVVEWKGLDGGELYSGSKNAPASESNVEMAKPDETNGSNDAVIA